MVETDIERARFNMIQQQIRPWDVMDERVLATLERIRREAFVPAAYRNLAFADIEIPIGLGEVMMPPKLEARMLQTLALEPSDKILEIGTGSGFVTACLAGLGAQVTSVDIHSEFTDGAGERLAEFGIGNVSLHTTDALSGLFQGERYDAIAVTGSLPRRDQARDFERMLSVGGRLFVITGEAPIMEALLITRVGGDQYAVESLFETEIPPLVNAAKPERFTF